MRTAFGMFKLALIFTYLFAVIPVASVPVLLSQTEEALVGLVTNPDGKPIPDVLVYGSESKECCPFKREQTKTDDSGHFTLNDPGAVVHFSAAKYRPKSWVHPANVAESKIILEPDTEPLIISSCRGKPGGMRRISWGKYGLQFDVPVNGFTIGGGKTDVDYVRWVIKPKSGTSYLAVWFGPYAFSSDPGDQLFLDSVSFSERTVSGERWGIDISGELRTGARWRHTYIGPGDGAEYKASPADVAALDQIINSACYIPLPKK
jgi:hypothetical protein